MPVVIGSVLSHNYEGRARLPLILAKRGLRSAQSARPRCRLDRHAVRDEPSHGRVKVCWLVQLRQSGTLWYLGISRQCPCEMQRELMRIAHVVILLHVLIG